MAAIARDRSGWLTRWNAGVTRPADPDAHIRAALAHATDNGGGQVVLWVERVDALLDAAAQAAGMTPWRKLLQLRCALPVRTSAIHTRPFTQADTAAFLRVNNSAFSWHPEQGGWDENDLSSHFTEPWFNADGFRIYEAGGQVQHSPPLLSFVLHQSH